MKPILPILAVLALGACAQTSMQPPPVDLAQRVSALNPNECSDATARALANAGLTAGQVDSVYYQPIMGGIDQDEVVGYIAWTRLDGQQGYLVVDMATYGYDTPCRVRTVYTRGGLEVAGVPSYSF